MCSAPKSGKLISLVLGESMLLPRSHGWLLTSPPATPDPMSSPPPLVTFLTLARLQLTPPLHQLSRFTSQPPPPSSFSPLRALLSAPSISTPFNNCTRPRTRQPSSLAQKCWISSSSRRREVAL